MSLNSNNIKGYREGYKEAIEEAYREAYKEAEDISKYSTNWG